MDTGSPIQCQMHADTHVVWIETSALAQAATVYFYEGICAYSCGVIASLM